MALGLTDIDTTENQTARPLDPIQRHIVTLRY